MPDVIAGFGRYARTYSEKSAPFGAGNQLDSLSAPGESACTQSVNEPSAFFFSALFFVPIE